MGITKVHTSSEIHLGDLYTPVQLYLKLREQYKNCLLLESTDSNNPKNGFSILCIKPISEFILTKGIAEISLPNQKNEKKEVSYKNFFAEFNAYRKSFALSGNQSKFSGFFGYVGWDAIPYFENIKFSNSGNKGEVDDIRLGLYQILIVFDHYHDEIELIENLVEGEKSMLENVKEIIQKGDYKKTNFDAEIAVSSNVSDETYKEMVNKSIKHCYRGDVFQIVPSRQFQRKYTGDDFNLYRSLRRVNPSPYLFYFDYTDYRIMGSSPEAQTVIQDKEAYIDPIAGTFKRTHDAKKDAALAISLQADPKESAEHIMLVDLARNDLSKNSDEVKVSNFKEVHYFSHVLHMVSRVKAKLGNAFDNLKVFSDAFPAGTLSGAPKYRALELIDEMENQNRGVYGGAIGFFGFEGDLNTAIVIRSFVSKDNVLYSQAGAGVVASSSDESELNEVNNKLAALDGAVNLARKMNNNTINDL